MILLEGRHGAITVYEDRTARDECPMSPRDVRVPGEKMAGMRHVVLHGSHVGDEGTEVGLEQRHHPEPSITFRTVDGAKSRTTTVTKAE